MLVVVEEDLAMMSWSGEELESGWKERTWLTDSRVKKEGVLKGCGGVMWKWPWKKVKVKARRARRAGVV